MGIQTLKNGKFRVQIRKKGFAKLDEVFDTLAEAEAALGERDRVVAKAKRGQKTLREVWEIYTLSAEWVSLAENTQSTYTRNISPALAKLGGYTLDALSDDVEIVQGHFDARARAGRGNETRRLEMSSLSALIEFCIKRKYVAMNPMRFVHRPEPVRRTRRVAVEEKASLQAAALSGTAAAQHARFNLLLGYIGCRPGELAHLLKEDINFRQSEVILRKTKGGRPRHAHLPSDAHGLVGEQIRNSYPDSPYLFNRRTREGSYGPYNYNNGHRQLKRNSVVPQGYHPHAMRREFVTTAVENGVPVSTIMAQTGHSSTQALDIYNVATGASEDVKAIFERLSQRMSQKTKDKLLVTLMEQGGATPEDIEKVLGVRPRADGWATWDDAETARKAREDKR